LTKGFYNRSTYIESPMNIKQGLAQIISNNSLTKADGCWGGPKKSPELFVTIMACILYGAKFPLAHL